MKITKNVFAGVLFVVAIYSFGALAEGFDSKPSSSNDSEVIPSLSVVFSKPLSLSRCVGICSAQPGVEVDMRWMNGSWFDRAENSFELHTSTGVKYSSFPVVVNGNSSQFDSEAINLGIHVRHRKLPRFEFSLQADMFGMAILRGDNTPRQIDFASAGVISLSYEVSPTFQTSLGLASHSVPSANSNWQSLNTLNLGFTWSAKRK